MAKVRVTEVKFPNRSGGNFSIRSRAVGDRTGVIVNTFNLDKLQKEVNGKALMFILFEALEPAWDQARENWPVLTGASQRSIDVVEVEEGPHVARAALQVGGDALKSDPDNMSGKDYAPYIEFNGSPSGRGQNTILHAYLDNERKMREIVHRGVSNLIARSLG